MYMPNMQAKYVGMYAGCVKKRENDAWTCLSKEENDY